MDSKVGNLAKLAALALGPPKKTRFKCRFSAPQNEKTPAFGEGSFLFGGECDSGLPADSDRPLGLSSFRVLKTAATTAVFPLP